MTNTTYYNLKKPEDSDNVLISDLNGNADAIDQALHGLDNGKASKAKPSKAGNLAALDESGNLTDSGRTPGAAGGVATLDETGKVPKTQLPKMDYDPAGTADSAVSAHDQDKEAHAGLLADNVQLKTVKAVLPYSSNWAGITYGDRKFVAVKQSPSSSYTAYSTDGVSWSAVGTSTEYACSVAYGGGRFVLIGMTGGTSYSADGKKWTTGGFLPSGGVWKKIAYGNGIFVAISANSDVAAYSTDGESWTKANMPSSVNWKSVAYGGTSSLNSKFVAIADGANNAACSTDGITWTASTLPSSGSWQDIVYGGGKFVAVKDNSMYGAQSEDGVDWSQDVYLGDANPWKSIAHGNGKFTVVASNGKSAFVRDVGNSGGSSSLTTPLVNCAALAFGNGKFVTVPISGNQVAISTDGHQWTGEPETICRPDGTPIAEAFSLAMGGSQIVSGYGVTPGSPGEVNAITVDLGFRPALIGVKGYAYDAWDFSTDSLRIGIGGGSSSYTSVFGITDNGFTVYAENSNGTAKGYSYLVFR